MVWWKTFVWWYKSQHTSTIKQCSERWRATISPALSPDDLAHSAARTAGQTSRWTKGRIRCGCQCAQVVACRSFTNRPTQNCLLDFTCACPNLSSVTPLLSDWNHCKYQSVFADCKDNATRIIQLLVPLCNTPIYSTFKCFREGGRGQPGWQGGSRKQKHKANLLV